MSLAFRVTTLPSHRIRPTTHHISPRCVAKPPRRISAVAKDLREALQSSLQARTSRIDVRLPTGAKLGNEKRGDEEPNRRRVAGDRELARIISGMFEGTGLSVCIAFATEAEMSAAKKMWGPVQCRLECWGKAPSGGRARGKGAKKSKAGFGKPGSAADGGGGSIHAEDDTDVYIVVGGGAPFMSRVRAVADSFGQDKLVIVANGNSALEQLPIDVARYWDAEFESVYHYAPNPHPKWSGGVLFRKFPDKWVFCRLTGVRMLQELIVSESRPTMDEIGDALQTEGTKPENGLLKKITGFMDRS